MRERPTVVLVHGGPGGYDRSFDLRDHGRSTRHDPEEWSFEVCADDVRTFCDVVGIVSPAVLDHFMGGFIAMPYGARHPGLRGLWCSSRRWLGSTWSGWSTASAAQQGTR
jgi:pimeloyl-ACP methyl ester carboxylesterase